MGNGGGGTGYAIEMTGVVKRYGKRVALDGLDLRVPTGALCGLVGSNGAGKTTSLFVCAGLLRADAGTVRVLGRENYDPSEQAGRLSIIPQDSDLPREGRALELLRYYARLQGMEAARADREAREALEWVHLTDRARSAVRTLSHGMKRRLMIAQAFLGDPELILLDEPLNGLDPKEVVHIRSLLTDRRGRQTIIVSSHNLHEIELLCDYLVFIEKGKLVRADTMETVTGNQQAVRYVLDGEPDAVADLVAAVTAAAPGVHAEWVARDSTLVCQRGSTGASIADLNRWILPVLLARGVSIVSVQPGHRLEAAYLAQA